MLKIDSEFHSEFESFEKKHNTKAYTKFSDIFNTFYDFKVTFDDPAKIRLKSISYLKPNGYLTLTTSYDYLLATIVLSKYPHVPTNNMFIDKQLQDKIESILFSYFTTLSFKDYSKLL
jgi:hypothetical protein